MIVPQAVYRKLRDILLHLNELALLIPMLLLAGGIYSLVQLSEAVERGSTQRFDDWAIRILRNPANPAIPIGPAWLPEVGRDLTALGGVAVLVLTIFAVAGFLLLEHKRRSMWLLLAASGGGLVLSLLLKHLVARGRPELVPHLSGVYTSSFPSGHSMLSATVYLTLGALMARTVTDRATRIYCVAVAGVISFLVGVSRIYMGVHYPTDVLAGWAAGALWALACWTLAAALQKRGAVEPPDQYS
jgi:undecaprenyl-diphosphatase